MAEAKPPTQAEVNNATLIYIEGGLILHCAETHDEVVEMIGGTIRLGTDYIKITVYRNRGEDEYPEAVPMTLDPSRIVGVMA